jgi:hypothetical protein
MSLISGSGYLRRTVVNKAQADGTKGEVAVVKVLLPSYPMAERRAKQGYRDRGDIGGVAPRLVIEVKHAPKSQNITGWLKEADREALNDGAELAVVWFKIPGTTSALDWPVMMRGSYFLPLLNLWVANRPTLVNGQQLELF